MCAQMLHSVRSWHAVTAVHSRQTRQSSRFCQLPVPALLSSPSSSSKPPGTYQDLTVNSSFSIFILATKPFLTRPSFRGTLALASPRTFPILTYRTVPGYNAWLETCNRMTWCGLHWCGLSPPLLASWPQGMLMMSEDLHGTGFHCRCRFCSNVSCRL